MKAGEMALVGILFLGVAYLLKRGILTDETLELLSVVVGMIFLLVALQKWISCSGAAGVSA
jgi:hypothetical protein